MLSTMMNTPLGVTTLHRFGARHFASSRVGDYDGARIQWRRYDEIDADSARLAHALLGLGLLEGDRVGTFMWNSSASRGLPGSALNGCGAPHRQLPTVSRAHGLHY